MQQIPASSQVKQLTDALLSAFSRREDAQANIKAADAEITAIRNLLAGVGIGQKLQQEADADAKVPAPAVQ